MWAAVVLCLGTAAPSLHTAFSAECTHQFDWFSVGLFYSHRLAGQPGPITRLLACTEEALRTYRGLDIGPTFVHPNLREHPLVAEKGYPSYNKPGSLMFWLDSARAPRETYIFFVDADMMLRQPVDAHALGASRGTVVSAEYTYLVGTDTGFAARFIRSSILHRQAQVGGFHILHREDVRRICPKWFDFTRRVRAFAAEHPDEFFAESMHLKTEEEADQGLRAVRHKQAKWHSEMYGYVFAAAEEGMRHVVVRDLMLYPGYVPYLNRPPTLLHYGADYKVARVPAAPGEPEDIRPPEGHAIHSEDFYFNKMCALWHARGSPAARATAARSRAPRTALPDHGPRADSRLHARAAACDRPPNRPAPRRAGRTRSSTFPRARASCRLARRRPSAACRTARPTRCCARSATWCASSTCAC